MRWNRREALRAAAATIGAIGAPALARAARRRLRLSHNNSATSAFQAGATAFAAAASELSGGRLAFEIYPNAAIAGDPECLIALSEGTIDALISSIGVTAAITPEIQLAEMPYLYDSVDVARRSFDGPLGRHCADILQSKSIVIAGWGEIGLRHVTANKPVRLPADLRDLKIRVQLSEPTLQTFLAMGAKAAPLPFGQLPEALRTGRFDAQENPLSVIIPAQLNKYQSHLSLTGHVYAPAFVAVAGDLWQSLDATGRRAIAGAGRAAAAAMRAFSDKISQEGVARLRAAGMTIVEDVDRGAMRSAVGPAIEKLGQMFGADAVKRIRDLA